jgi:hypothetical protein
MVLGKGNMPEPAESQWLGSMLPDDRKLLLEVTQRLARRKRKRSNPTQVTVEIKDRTS